MSKPARCAHLRLHARSRRAPRPCRRASSRAASGCPATRRRRGREDLANCPSASGASISSQPSCVEPLGPEWPSWMPILASVSACTKSTMRRHAASCASRVEPGAARRDAAFRRHAGHLGEDEPGAALGALARSARSASRRACRPLPCIAPSARRRRGWRAPCRATLNGTNIGATCRRGLCARRCRPSNQRFGAGEPRRIALAQVLVADALRAGEQRIIELHRDPDRDSARRSRTTPSSCAPRSAASAPRAGARPRSARRRQRASARCGRIRPARSRFRARAWCRSRRRSARSPPRRQAARCCRGSSARTARG